MTLIKDRCDLWIKYVYDQWIENWLRNAEKVILHDSTKNMVERMKSAALDEETWALMERLKNLSDGIYNDGVANESKSKYEKSNIYIECALSAYRLGDLQEALNLFHVSIEVSSKRSLHRAISYWLCGCIQWQLPAHLVDAVLSWERSMQTINEVGIDKSNSEYATKEKCDEVAKVMRGALDKATRDNIPPLPPALNARSKSNVSNFSAYEAKLKFIPFYGSIPAGSPEYALKYPIDNVGVSVLEIENGCFYKIFNIKQEKEIKLNLSSDYFMLKVKGESMNMAAPVKIDNEDYVLLVKKIPQDNDIVAAVIVNEGVGTTLKRYRVENGGEFFVPESDDKSKIQRRKSNEDYVQGVVLAICKPSDD